MIYAIFMLLVLAILFASWCGSTLEPPLFVVTSHGYWCISCLIRRPRLA